VPRATANAAYKTAVKTRRPGEESERAIVPRKAVNAAGGKGITSLDDVTPASKEEGLWQH
jgi:hypothetical protein